MVSLPVPLPQKKELILVGDRYTAKGNNSMDASRSNKRLLCIFLSIVALGILLIIITGSPSAFLNWVVSILTALTLVLIFVAASILLIIFIGAVIHRYARGRYR